MDLKIFENEEFGKVRTVEDDGKILFCGTDVAKALGYADSPKAIKTHCKKDGWAFYPVIDSVGRKQDAKFINEGNVYRLITHSKLPSAEKFETWLFDEVLPQIRKTGGYIPVKENESNEEFLARAFIIASETLKKKDEIIAIQNRQLEEQKPLVEFAAHVTESSDTIDIGELAKVLHNEHINIGRNKLFEWLRNNKILMSNNTPYQKYIESNYFDVIETTKDTAYGTKVFTKTLVTGKGQIWITEKLRKEYMAA